jgi:hypothetical protein
MRAGADQRKGLTHMRKPQKPQTVPEPKPISRYIFVVCVAIAAIVSALLSTYVLSDPWNLSQVAFLSQKLSSLSSEPFKVPILPGVYFGLVIAFTIYFVERDMLRAFAAFVAIIFAWMIAFETALKIASMAKDASRPDDPAILLAGPAAGLVGSAITVIGVSLVSTDFRDAKSWFRTITIGTIAGLLLYDNYLFKLLGLPWVVEEHYRLKVYGNLFTVWQPAVAASIAYGLATPKLNRFTQLAAWNKAQEDIFDQVGKLAKLHVDGELTDEEFRKLKGKSDCTGKRERRCTTTEH